MEEARVQMIHERIRIACLEQGRVDSGQKLPSSERTRASRSRLAVPMKRDFRHYGVSHQGLRLGNGRR